MTHTNRIGLALLPAIVLLHVACNGCSGTQPTPPTPIPPDPIPLADGGAPTDAYSAACAHLRSLGCREGLAADCPRVMRRADAMHLTLVPLACMQAARTAEDARGCGGFVRCAQ